MERRGFLALTGASVLAATAGCSDDGGDDNSGGDGGGGDDGGGGGGNQMSDPESVVQAFYDLRNEVDENTEASEVIDRLQALAHSASPFMEFQESDIDPAAESDVTIDSVETEVTSENLSAEELDQQYALSQFGTVGEEELAAIAEENAIVQAEITQSGAGVEEGNEETSAEHLTATEGGDWLLVF